MRILAGSPFHLSTINYEVCVTLHSVQSVNTRATSLNQVRANKHQSVMIIIYITLNLI